MSSVEIHRMLGGGSSFWLSEPQEIRIREHKSKKGRKIFIMSFQ
jgi:hypothetical protein